MLLLLGCENSAGCISPCNGHCFNNVPCNSTNGYCSSGCESGYVGYYCNQSKYSILFWTIVVNLYFTYTQQNF